MLVYFIIEFYNYYGSVTNYKEKGFHWPRIGPNGPRHQNTNHKVTQTVGADRNQLNIPVQEWLSS
jgi:hypothetical protein